MPPISKYPESEHFVSSESIGDTGFDADSHQLESVNRILDAKFINQLAQNVPVDFQAGATPEKPANPVDYARISSWNIVRARELESGGPKKYSLDPQSVKSEDLGLAA